MPLTDTQVGNALSNGTYMTQLQGAIQASINIILVELSTTADYVVRRKFAQDSLKNLPQAAQRLGIAVAQILAPTVNDLSVVTDAQINAAVATAWTQAAYAFILPS